MRPAFLLALPVLLLAHAATAQQLRFGVKAGANYTDQNLRNVGGFKRLLGINAGVVGRYALGADGFWNLQAEVLYSGKGQRYVPGFVAVGTKPRYYNNRLHYLDLPILAKINAGGLTFEAGPQLSYLLGVSTDTPNGRFTGRSGLRPLQLGYTVGVGYELPAGYSLPVRYAADVTSIYKNTDFFGPDHSTVFQAQLGYLLPGQK